MEEKIMSTSSNGEFRRKKGFTIASNSAIRDKKLSLKGKGLYTLIQSYITHESLAITKAFIMCQSGEKETSFNRAWNELKDAGYLKIHQTPSATGVYKYEYELLDEANTMNGAYLFRYNMKGELTSTNLTSGPARKKQTDKNIENDIHVKEAKTGNSSEVKIKNSVEQQQEAHFVISEKEYDKQYDEKHYSEKHYSEKHHSANGGSNIILHNNTIDRFDNLSIYHQETEEQFKKQIEYDRWMDDESIDQALLNLIVKTAANLLIMPDDYSWRINKTLRTASEIRLKINQLNHEHIGYILESIGNHKSPIKNVIGFIRSALYNAPDTYSLYMSKRDIQEKKSDGMRSDNYQSSDRRASQFKNFHQRTYDYGAMEKEIVQRLQKKAN